MPEPRTKAQRRFVEARAELEAQLGRLPTTGELGARLGVTSQAVSAQLRALGLPSLRAAKRERGELVRQREQAAREARAAQRAAKLASLVSMAEAGMPQYEIAARLGEHQSGVCAKLRRAGVKCFDRWTVETALEMATMLADGTAVPKVARALGRTPAALVSAWRKLHAAKPGPFARAHARLTTAELERARTTVERTKAGYRNRAAAPRVGEACPAPSSTSSAASRSTCSAPTRP